MVPTTRFTDPAAVEAWDRWFRWRDAGRIRDRTIDATWWRVARAIASTADWAERYADVFSRWQLLPDERLLKSAGTGAPLHGCDTLSATLDVASFVRAPRTAHARIDRESFTGIAGLAVRLLDDALLHIVVTGAAPADPITHDTDSTHPLTGPRLHIGVLGLADALQLLGVDYDSTAAVEIAAQVARLLAEGTFAGSVELARERGARVAPALARLTTLERMLPPVLVRDLRRYGLRHRRLTAIERQPRLALLANRASDALYPSPARAPSPSLATSAGDWRPSAMPPPGADAPRLPERLVAAQQAISAAMRPWIDAPIDYPLAVSLSRVG